MKELTSKASQAPTPKPFTWNKPVATSGRAQPDSTIRRLKENSAVKKAPESQQVQKQFDNFVAKRRGEK